MLAPCDPKPPRYHGDGALIRQGGGVRGVRGGWGGGRWGGGGESGGRGTSLCESFIHQGIPEKWAAGGGMWTVGGGGGGVVTDCK